MTKNMLDEMAKAPSHWLSGKGEESMVVLATRVRLARNVSGCAFPSAADGTVREKVVKYFESARQRSDLLGKGAFFKTEELAPLDREFLVERHLMSPTFMKDDEIRGLYLSDGEQVSIMVNEEDHIRMQALLPGLSLKEALRTAMEYDNELGKFLEYDYDPDFGFLTACPTNVGTGMRASALIHLPGLVITKEIDKVIAKITRMNIAVRGFYGEGTDVLGNLFQVSNQRALGVSEDEIIETISGVCKMIIDEEAAARKMLVEEASEQIQDKIWRAYGILKHARMLSSDEVMNLLSAVRLGVAMKILEGIEIPVINELLLLSQPAHLQKYYAEDMDPERRDIIRAQMVREKLEPYRV